MGLSDLVLPGMEMYGGIEIKRNGKKNTIRAFVSAVVIHLLLFGLYFGWNALMKEDDSKVPRIRRISSLAELAPPPSTEDQMEAAPLAAAPAVDVAKPTFGIPVPVPDIQAPNQTMPDLNNMPVQTSNGDANGGAGTQLVGSDAPVHVTPPPEPVVEETPDRDAFVDVSEEPKPVQNIQSLIVYPEVAKRSGLEGKVIASVLIGKDGRVEKVAIDKTDNEIFNKAAEDALMRARFTPAKQGTTPVKVWWTIPISFKLSK